MLALGVGLGGSQREGRVKGDSWGDCVEVSSGICLRGRYDSAITCSDLAKPYKYIHYTGNRFVLVYTKTLLACMA